MWDVLSYVIPAGFTLVVLAAADVDALITGEAATATILLFVLHGLSMVRIFPFCLIQTPSAKMCRIGYRLVVVGTTTTLYCRSKMCAIFAKDSVSPPLPHHRTYPPCCHDGNPKLQPSYTYLMSFFFKSYSTAQNTFLFHNFIMGLIVPIAVTVMGFFEGSVNDASTVMTFLFNFCPQFALGLGLFNMGFMTIFGLIDDETYTPLHLRITGRNLIYMGTLTVVYGILLLLVER